jgi:hypothetical protein
MPYRWKNKIDVDEAVVVIKNSLDERSELPNWLIRTLNGAVTDSDPALGKYFFEEVRKYAPEAMKYFDRGARNVEAQ